MAAEMRTASPVQLRHLHTVQCARLASAV